jgi:hypothetical protein
MREARNLARQVPQNKDHSVVTPILIVLEITSRTSALSHRLQFYTIYTWKPSKQWRSNQKLTP